MTGFAYPKPVRERRHGPGGYEDYGSYRPWLRDEFTFRCIYCLCRERWGRVSGDFDLDHFIPQSVDSSRRNDYANLFYSCRSCNALKGNQEISDPGAFFTDGNVVVHPDGTIEGMTLPARRIIMVLGLNSDRYVEWRRLWMRNIELAAEYDPDQYRRLMSYPDDLPDLSRLRPPENTRPEGIRDSYRARRDRGELEETY